MDERILSVKMFGGFVVSYGSEALFIGKQKGSKFAQLFQILMTRPGQGFDKREIADSLYAWNEVDNSNASLNNAIFRLRKYLRTSPLPEGEYLVLNDGVLSFGNIVGIKSDVWDFECLAKQFEKEQDRRKKADICEKACELYRGEFLPYLSYEPWIVAKNEYYRMLHTQMMEYLLRYFKEEADYGKLEKTAAVAVVTCPDKGWELWWVDSLISMGDYRKAEQVYQKMVERLQRNGGFLTEEMQAHFQKTGARLRRPEEAEEDIEKYLAESGNQKGAYGCTLPAFSDCLHMLKRIFTRGGVNGFSLLLFTILDTRGRPARERGYCERQGEKLLESFQACLRKGDVYAKYSDSQYLVLCASARRENIPEIGARINTDFRKRCGGRSSISFGFLEDETV